MTKTFAVDARNDLIIGYDKKISVAENLTAVLHICANAAKTIRNEMLYAKDQGLPNFETIWQGRANLNAWETAFRTRIMQMAEVSAIDSLSIWCEGNSMKYAATLQTIYGIGTLNGGTLNGGTVNEGTVNRGEING